MATSREREREVTAARGERVTEWLMKHAAYGKSKARTGTGCEVWPGRRGSDRKLRPVQSSLPLTSASERTVTGFALRPSPGAGTPCRAPLIMGRSQKHEEVRRDTPPPFNTVFGVTAVNIAFFLPLPVNWRDRWTVSASAGG
ncbi:hypothetical protein E2C01_074521 [Portunus trituberculatus]|uniref:Uncharacterized protein n=1 Tax=Portunus trituberculatus TaxID=210409 RepID=A0A5B7I3J7_PORTR|nr:hypothetical protein [Portunus trituberculatus]